MEQLSLFEDKYVLLNTGTQALVNLNLEEAQKALQRYRDIYKDNGSVDAKLNLADFLIEGMTHVPAPGPDEPAYLYTLWMSFAEYAESLGGEAERILPIIKDSYFRELIEAIDRAGISDVLYLSDGVPLGYVFMLAGYFDKAVESLQAGLLAVPDNAAMYGYLGDAYICKGEVDVARRCYLEACLINPEDIDWSHLKDRELTALHEHLMKSSDMDDTSVVGWLPCHAYLQGILQPKKIQLHEELKSFVEGYLNLQKEFKRNPTPDITPKLFIRAIILCDNEGFLKHIKGVDFIDVRRHMKEMDPALFARYMKFKQSNK